MGSDQRRKTRTGAAAVDQEFRDDPLFHGFVRALGAHYEAQVVRIPGLPRGEPVEPRRAPRASGRPYEKHHVDWAADLADIEQPHVTASEMEDALIEFIEGKSG